jgi:histidinol dehydrogenase
MPTANTARYVMPLRDVPDDATLVQAVREIRLKATTGAEGAAADAEAAVRDVLREIGKRGDAAVADFTDRFDNVKLNPDEFELTAEQIADAAATVDPDLRAALERAHDNILAFHEKHLRQSWEETDADGTTLGQRLTPVESAGLYVPGGTAFYPSSVLMNIVPAKVAGVPEIVMMSPPSYRGTIHPIVLCAAQIAGAHRVFRIGGAQAIAALAYGTDTIPAVAKIAGPGNIFVTLAKRFVSGVCDIDKEAGPSEVVVVADVSANPDWAAAELICQAEHDPDARAVLIGVGQDVCTGVLEAAERQLRDLPRADIARKSFADYGAAYTVQTIDAAGELANAIAPEHMSIQTEDPRAFLEKVPNVGCAVLGGGTPVAVGDYYAGPNHILPTERRARFASPLTAEDFRKVTSVIEYSPERLRKDAPDITRLARAEELEAHARAVEFRL